MIGSRLGASALLGAVSPLAILAACSVFGMDHHIAHMSTCHEQVVRGVGMCAGVFWSVHL